MQNENFISILQNSGQNSSKIYTKYFIIRKVSPFICESYAFTRESFALIRENFILIRVNSWKLRVNLRKLRVNLRKFCQIYELIRESYASIREKYNFPYKNELNGFSYWGDIVKCIVAGWPNMEPTYMLI